MAGRLQLEEPGEQCGKATPAAPTEARVVVLKAGESNQGYVLVRTPGSNPKWGIFSRVRRGTHTHMMHHDAT